MTFSIHSSVAFVFGVGLHQKHFLEFLVDFYCLWHGSINQTLWYNYLLPVAGAGLGGRPIIRPKLNDYLVYPSVYLPTRLPACTLFEAGKKQVRCVNKYGKINSNYIGKLAEYLGKTWNTMLLPELAGDVTPSLGETACYRAVWGHR